MRESQARVSIRRLRLKKDGRVGDPVWPLKSLSFQYIERRWKSFHRFVSFSHYFNARLEQLSPPRFYSYILSSLHVTFTVCHLRGRESWSYESTRRNYSLRKKMLMPTILFSTNVAKWESLSLRARPGSKRIEVKKRLPAGQRKLSVVDMTTI